MDPRRKTLPRAKGFPFGSFQAASRRNSIWKRTINAFGTLRPPQPAIMFVSRGLARNARDLSFCTLLAQWSPVLLQPPERQIVTLPEGLISTR